MAYIGNKFLCKRSDTAAPGGTPPAKPNFFQQGWDDYTNGWGNWWNKATDPRAPADSGWGSFDAMYQQNPLSMIGTTAAAAWAIPYLAGKLGEGSANDGRGSGALPWLAGMAGLGYGIYKAWPTLSKYYQGYRALRAGQRLSALKNKYKYNSIPGLVGGVKGLTTGETGKDLNQLTEDMQTIKRWTPEASKFYRNFVDEGDINRMDAFSRAVKAAPEVPEATQVKAPAAVPVKTVSNPVTTVKK